MFQCNPVSSSAGPNSERVPLWNKAARLTFRSQSYWMATSPNGSEVTDVTSAHRQGAGTERSARKHGRKPRTQVSRSPCPVRAFAKEIELNLTALNVSDPRPDGAARPSLLCLSHLRWDFVTQRPQHLMRRAGNDFVVTFFEEPLAELSAPPTGTVRLARDGNVRIVTPLLPPSVLGTSREPRLLRSILDRCLGMRRGPLIAWYYSPMMLGFTRDLHPAVTVYDCMDELSAFLNAPDELRAMEDELMARADLVFTGGYSLQDARKDRHPSVHCFPSSVERPHFAQARKGQPDPEAQAHIPHPRVGFFGVVDERMDLALVDRAARESPDLQFVMIGPVVKIDPKSLPQRPNIHWLGRQDYQDLPAFLSNWDLGWMPFALNEATRFISPTKTPEFLAAGLAVVSTAVRDVIRAWGSAGLVRIACADTMTLALKSELVGGFGPRRKRIDAALAKGSWDRTWQDMAALVAEELSFDPFTPTLNTNVTSRSVQAWDGVE